MKKLPFEWLLKGLVGLILLIFIASCNVPAYAKHVHQKADELALVGYQYSTGVQYTNIVRNISMRLHFMAELERDTLACAGYLLSLSTNPFQLCHPHLVVNGKAPLYQQEAMFMPTKNKKAVTL